MMRTVKDLAWIGGLLEGEGSFAIRNGCATIDLQMSDRDTVKRACEILGVPIGARSRQPKGKPSYKPIWHTKVCGIRAISWMMTLYQFFGERRQQKITEILGSWKASKAAPRAPRGQRFMAVCHPDRVRAGRMLCKTCYMRQYRSGGALGIRELKPWERTRSTKNDLVAERPFGVTK